MSDRTFSATIIFDKEYRDDDAQVILDAIAMIKGVASTHLRISTSEDYLAYARARQDLQKKLFEVLKDE